MKGFGQPSNALKLILGLRRQTLDATPRDSARLRALRTCGGFQRRTLHLQTLHVHASRRLTVRRLMDFSPLEELLYYDFYDDTSYVWEDTSYVWDDIKMVPKIQEPPALESITQFDDKGDIRLVVTEPPSEESSAKCYTFIVSSKVMSLACDAWNTMLNGQFIEAQSTSGQRKIGLPEDDPRALAILLNIAHLRFDLVPSPISFSLLLKVTVLTDKYDMTRVIRPWATSWIDGLGSQLSVTSPGHEEWLWIAWELGNKSKFECLAAHLVKTTRLGKDGKCTTQSGKILDPCGSYQQFPPDIIGMRNGQNQHLLADLRTHHVQRASWKSDGRLYLTCSMFTTPPWITLWKSKRPGFLCVKAEERTEHENNATNWHSGRSALLCERLGSGSKECLLQT